MTTLQTIQVPFVMSSNECIHFLLPFESWPGLSFSIPSLQLRFTGLSSKPEASTGGQSRGRPCRQAVAVPGEAGRVLQHSAFPLAGLWLFPRTSKLSCRAASFLEHFAFFFSDILQVWPRAMIYFLSLLHELSHLKLRAALGDP